MVVATLAVLVMVSAVTVTVVVQRGSVLPAGQLFPDAAEVTVLARMWSPVSGLCTVIV